ncbi:MAG: hypothetical protein CMM93_01335 [Rickettsiales bacterium]|nr:hypothetical protein [Rickettsiales bacterium]
MRRLLLPALAVVAGVLSLPQEAKAGINIFVASDRDYGRGYDHHQLKNYRYFGGKKKYYQGYGPVRHHHPKPRGHVRGWSGYGPIGYHPSQNRRGGYYCPDRRRWVYR